MRSTGREWREWGRGVKGRGDSGMGIEAGSERGIGRCERVEKRSGVGVGEGG